MANLTARVEARLAENKTGIKTYASHQFAEARATKIVEQAQNYHDTKIDMDYVVVFLPHVKRWTVVFMYSSFLQRAKSGGYIGWIADAGFLTV